MLFMILLMSRYIGSRSMMDGNASNRSLSPKFMVSSVDTNSS